MSPSARKALGSLALIAYLIVFVALAAVLGERVLARAPWWAELLYFVVAGVIWALPLKPLFAWMNKPG
jgi:hypothetical protein